VFFQLKNILNIDRTFSHTTLSAETNALLHQNPRWRASPDACPKHQFHLIQIFTIFMNNFIQFIYF